MPVTNRRPIPFVGQLFGNLVVLDENGRTSQGETAWKCRCSCGNIGVYSGNHLRTGHTRSCGCLRIATVVKRSTRHDHCKRNAISPTYHTWSGILKRCTDRKSENWPRYGGRGIQVCERWYNFLNFLADMGEKPAGLTIERIDNDGDYEPRNCRWATKQEQVRNTRQNRFYAYHGKTLCVTDWAKKRGVARSTLVFRLTNWSIDRALGHDKHDPD